MHANRNHKLGISWRYCRLALHILYGVAAAALVLPLASIGLRQHLKQRWSGKLLAILQIKPRFGGALPARTPHGLLLVSNHISWLDIFLINAAQPIHFVSKSEVRNWPIFGWLSEKAGTLFIDRARKRDTHRIKHTIQDTLKSGYLVGFFPEGTTTGGNRILRFNSSLFQAAIDCGCPVQPLTIRYPHSDGSANLAPAYFDEMSFGDSIRQIMAEKEIAAELMFLEPIQPAGKTRRELAVEAEATIASALRLANPRNGTGTPSDPPDAAQ